MITDLGLQELALSAGQHQLKVALLLSCLVVVLFRRLRHQDGGEQTRRLPSKFASASGPSPPRPLFLPLESDATPRQRRPNGGAAGGTPTPVSGSPRYAAWLGCCVARPQVGGEQVGQEADYSCRSRSTRSPHSDAASNASPSGSPLGAFGGAGYGGGGTGGAWTVEAIVAAGVPAECAEAVRQLGLEVGVSGDEPLSDPTTLWRFASAREFNIKAGKDMYTAAMAWRASLSMKSVMESLGDGEAYLKDGSRDTKDCCSWSWTRSHGTPESDFASTYGFWGRLSSKALPDQAPIAIWRVGEIDVKGYTTEKLLGLVEHGFISHMEDLLQAGRAESRKSGKIVRARLILDCHNLKMSNLKYLPAVRHIFGLGKQFFPEVTASITLVRAPKITTFIYKAVEPFLTPVMKRKVRILGNDFEAGLRSHAGLEKSVLPAFLGGRASNAEVCEAKCVPDGFGRQSGLGGT